MTQAALADRVAIVIPVLNEERYIQSCLAVILEQADAIDAEVVVMDGGSDDATCEIVRLVQAGNPRLSLRDNPARLQSAALNLAARTLSPQVSVIVRVDAHATYRPDFVATCVAALRAHDATSVVVPMRTVGKDGMQRAIAAVQNSPLGNGGSAHRSEGRSGFVVHGHHAAFDRGFFQSLGGYDESFSHNEDAELDERAGQAGGRIWMCSEATIDYFPRTRLGALGRQYFNHGKGRARTLLKHRLWPRLRQLAAPIIMLGCLAGLAMMPISLWFAAVPASYAIGCIGWGVVTAVRRRDAWLLAMGPAAMTVHLCWAAGFFATVLGARNRGSKAEALTAIEAG